LGLEILLHYDATLRDMRIFKVLQPNSGKALSENVSGAKFLEFAMRDHAMDVQHAAIFKFKKLCSPAMARLRVKI
jgi:hypothetical protein